METTVNTELLLKIANTQRLPSLPEVAVRLIEVAQQSDPDIREVCQIIRSDPAISGKILQTVNSPLFGFRSRVETIDEAVPKLGIAMIRTLILGFHLSSHHVNNQHAKPLLQDLWRSCLTQAVFAESLAEKSNADAACCFMAAMLQDIGILAMISERSTEYVEHVLRHSTFPNVVAAERAHFGFSHVDVSVEMLNKWNLGSVFGDSISSHHDRISQPNGDRSDDAVPLKIILQAANLGAGVVRANRRSGQCPDISLIEWLGFLGTHFRLNHEDADQLISEVTERVDEYSVIFHFDIGEQICVDQVIADAKELLQEIAIKNHLDLLSSTADLPKQKPERNELYRDFLTNLFNRRFVNEHLGKQIDSWILKGKPIALLFLDVDKFKSINDSFGHAVGDQAIKHVADWLSAQTRSSDYSIRLGGDEFLVVMQIKERQYQSIADRIALNIPPMSLSDGQQFPISLSVGCLFYQPGQHDFPDINRLIDQADQLMYDVEKKGGANISFHKIAGRRETVSS